MSLTVSVLIPVFNNESSLDELYRRIAATLDGLGRRFEIIFVNDGSSDGSLGILRGLAAADPRCVVLNLSRNFGQHPAISAALQRATGDINVLMDADLQDRPEELPRLLEPFETQVDVDIVYTTFELAAGAKSRASSRLFHRAFARLSDVHVPPNLGTYRAFSSQVRAALLDYPERNAVYGPLMSQMGFGQIYIEVPRDAPAGRTTSYNFSRRLALALSSLISYSSVLYRFVISAGLALTVLSSGYLVVIFVQYLTGFRALVNGQLLLLVITVLMSGVLLMSVGVLTAYTYRIFQEVLARPRFHISREFGTGLRSEES